MRRGEIGPVAITCFSGGRVTARLSSQQGSAPGPRRSMRANDVVVKEPCGGPARVTKTSRAFAPGATIAARGETGVPPFCLPPRSVRAEVGPVAIRCFSGGRVRARLNACKGSAPGPIRTLPMGAAIVKERGDRRAPRSSILAQLGGVACPPARDPRHPVIGD